MKNVYTVSGTMYIDGGVEVVCHINVKKHDVEKETPKMVFTKEIKEDKFDLGNRAKRLKKYEMNQFTPASRIHNSDFSVFMNGWFDETNDPDELKEMCEGIVKEAFHEKMCKLQEKVDVYNEYLLK